jgi:hypothetical protein
MSSRRRQRYDKIVAHWDQNRQQWDFGRIVKDEDGQLWVDLLKKHEIFPKNQDMVWAETWTVKPRLSSCNNNIRMPYKKEEWEQYQLSKRYKCHFDFSL